MGTTDRNGELLAATGDGVFGAYIGLWLDDEDGEWDAETVRFHLHEDALGGGALDQAWCRDDVVALARAILGRLGSDVERTLYGGAKLAGELSLRMAIAECEVVAANPVSRFGAQECAARIGEFLERGTASSEALDIMARGNGS